MSSPCPVCGGVDIGTLGEVDCISINVCQKCGSVIACCPEPGSQFYESDYVQGGKFGYAYSDVATTPPGFGEAERRRYGKLRRFGQVVEIGAGSGIFQAHLRVRGVCSIGIERSEMMRRIAKRDFGLDLLDSIDSASSLISANVGYCLVLIEVIEHISDPRKFIRETLKALPRRPAGIYFTTPNCDAVKLLGIRWDQVKPPEHLILYGKKGLEELMASFGYKIEDVSYYHSIFLHLAIKYFGTRSRPRKPYFWVVAGFLRLVDRCICLLLPSRFSTGLEVLVVDNGQVEKYRNGFSV